MGIMKRGVGGAAVWNKGTKYLVKMRNFLIQFISKAKNFGEIKQAAFFGSSLFFRDIMGNYHVNVFGERESISWLTNFKVDDLFRTHTHLTRFDSICVWVCEMDSLKREEAFVKNFKFITLAALVVFSHYTQSLSLSGRELLSFSYLVWMCVCVCVSVWGVCGSEGHSGIWNLIVFRTSWINAFSFVRGGVLFILYVLCDDLAVFIWNFIRKLNPKIIPITNEIFFL